MARQLSVVAVYPPNAEFESVVRALEDVFNAELEISDHSPVGGACARTTGARMPDGLAFHAAKRRIKKELPDVRAKMTGRLTEPRLARPGRHVAIGIAIGVVASFLAGIALLFVSELLNPLVARMRGAPG